MTHYTVNASILLTHLPILERPAAVRTAGFDAVEFWWPFATAVPSDREVTSFVTAVRNAGVQLSGLNFNLFLAVSSLIIGVVGSALTNLVPYVEESEAPNLPRRSKPCEPYPTSEL